ncbi:MAG: ATP-binding protein [Verrucomicrobiota bacterium]
MSLAPAASPIDIHDATASPLEQAGIIVIEARATTPLGPKIVFANEETSTLSGYPLNSLIGSPLGLIYDRNDLSRLIEKLPLIASSPDYCWMERCLVCNGGRRLPVKWTIRPTQSREGNSGHFTLTLSRVTESKEETPVKESVEATPQREPSIEQSRSESLALAAGGVAHDFKNALQSIKTNLELAQRASTSRGSLDEYLADAAIALGDAETLAHQMLAFTKGEESTGSIFSISDLVKRVSRLCTAGSGVRCRMRLDPKARPVEGDPNQIYQVLHNLVINACQAMPNGGTLDLSLANIDFEEGENQFKVSPGRYTVISVRDRGCGISKEELPCIFDRSFTTKENGSGFGLASCLALVEKHGGSIKAASKPGVGTEFLVFLPSAPEGSEVSAPPAKPRIEHSPPADRTQQHQAENLRVLVVEDQQGVARATCRMLEYLGHRSVVAGTGEKAIEYFVQAHQTEEPIDIVLLDMTLPGGLDGHAVLKELRRIDATTVVIATSGYFEEGPAEALAGSGFDAILAKPYAMDSLAITLNQAAHS